MLGWLDGLAGLADCMALLFETPCNSGWDHWVLLVVVISVASSLLQRGLPHADVDNDTHGQWDLWYAAGLAGLARLAGFAWPGLAGSVRDRVNVDVCRTIASEHHACMMVTRTMFWTGSSRNMVVPIPIRIARVEKWSKNCLKMV